MKTLKEVTDNLIACVEAYEHLSLFDVNTLSEILRDLDVNLSCLVHIRDEYDRKHKSIKFNSSATTEARKEREADFQVPELDFIRKILRHYGEVQKSIRTQISLRKGQDN